ncbi:MAG: hypothetical protein AB1487_02815 [Thermodesulfobacteriota bacterium]
MARGKKGVILFILLAVLLGLQVHRFWVGGAKDNAQSRWLTQRSKTRSHDLLKLRLDLLEPRKIEVTASRNLFASGDEEAKVVAPVKPVVPDVPLVVEPPEPGLPDLEYIGFVESAGEKIGFFTRGQAPLQEILMLKINEQVEGRFRLTSITADWVRFCNVNTGKEAELKIVEKTSMPAGSPFRPSPQRPLPGGDTRPSTQMPPGFPRPEVRPEGLNNSDSEQGVRRSFRRVPQ